MEARITNFGRARPFPTAVGNLFIPNLQPIYLYDKKLVKELQAYNERDDIQLKIEILDDEGAPNYSKMKVQKLRSIAAKLGIKGFFTMKKADLIKKLEEKDESTTY